MKNEAYKVTLLPRYIRVGAAPAYLGMDRNRFTAEIRPYLTEIVMGKRSKAFDRLELDAIADQYKERNGRPGRLQGERLWDGKRRPASSGERAFGTSTNGSKGSEFAKALDRLNLAKPKGISQD